MAIDWQPIETAPKTGERLLLWFPLPIFTTHTIFGRWDSAPYMTKPKPYWSHDMERLYGVRETRINQPTFWARIEGPNTD